MTLRTEPHRSNPRSGIDLPSPGKLPVIASWNLPKHPFWGSYAGRGLRPRGNDVSWLTAKIVRMCLLAMVLVSFGETVRAHPPVSGPASPSVSHRAWTRQMGAPFFVQSITQDRQGFLWVGSADGLFRFDGVRFEPVAPARGHKRTALAISALAAAPNGDVWVGYAGRGGVAVYRNGEMRDAGLPDPGGEITKILISRDGKPWVINSAGGGDNILRWTGQRWLPVRGPDGISFADAIDLVEAADGAMWTVVRGELKVARPGDRRFRATAIRSSDEASALARDTHGQILLADSGGVFRILTGPDGMPVRAVSISGPPPAFGVLRVVVDHQGLIWGTTTTNGVFYGAEGRDFTHVSRAEGLTSPRAMPIFVDREGNVWTGGEGGLDRFSKPVVETVPSPAPDTQGGFKLGVDPAGRVTITAGEALWDMTAPGGPLIAARLPDRTYGACTGMAGQVFVISETGIREIRGGKIVRTTPWPVEPMAPPACAGRRDGVVYVVIPTTGLFRLRNGQWDRMRLPGELEQVSNLRFDRHGRLIVISGGQEIAVIDGIRTSRWRLAKIGFEIPTSINFLGDDVVIGGLTGLLRLREGRASRLDFETYPWLRDVRGLVTARDGYAWLLGYKGIIRVRARDLAAAFDHPGQAIPYQVFDDDNASVGISQRGPGPQAAVDRNGMLWFVTRGSVLRVSPDRAVSGGHATVAIESVAFDGNRITRLNSLRLPGGARTITFQFGVADLTTPTHRRFRYRLDGHDPDWREIGSQRQISLTNLGPGSYTLVVQTDDERGQWVSPGARLLFEVAPLFYQTWWFRALAIVAALAAIWLFVRWRVRSAADAARRGTENRLSERMRIARDLHDTFLQGFQGSALRLQAIADRLPGDSRERGALETVLTGIDRILEEGRRRVQAMRGDDQPIELEPAVRAIATDLLDGAGCGWTLETIGTARQVSAPVADEILLVIREALANVVRHARASAVALAIDYGRAQVRVDIVDDGVGIDLGAAAQSASNGHFGLVGMRERAQQIDATLDIAPLEIGTRVTLAVPARRAYVAT